MIQTINHYIHGYLQIQLCGFSPERFLNLCRNNQIEIWNLEYHDFLPNAGEGGPPQHGYRFLITLKGYRKIRPLVRKSHVRLKIVNRLGFPFFLQRNRRRKLYACGLTAFFLLLAVMSQFIWNITLEGNYRFTDDTILKYLDQQEIRYGIMKNTINCDEIEAAIRMDFPEIIWVSARVSGTRLMIKVKENEVMASIPLKDESPRDLVADKDGVITSMIVRSGKAQVAIGDTVEKGQVLVSGIIPIYNDALELVNEQYVRADADIYAETTEYYTAAIPYLTFQRMNTGKTRHGIQLSLMNRSLVLLIPGSKTNLWEFVRESRQLSVLGDFYLPVWLEQITATEYTLYERSYTKNELQSEKNKIHEQKMLNLLEKGVQIIHNSVKIVDNGTGWQVQGEFLIQERIGIGQSINQNQTEETEQSDERN
ncbi:MAG: sporulation protein YqfD [Lachnospiraceae bacterium]